MCRKLSKIMVSPLLQCPLMGQRKLLKGVIGVAGERASGEWFGGVLTADIFSRSMRKLAQRHVEIG